MGFFQYVKNLTISQSKGHHGVESHAGMSFHLFNLNIEKSKRGGVYVNGSKRNTMSNCLKFSHARTMREHLVGG